MTDPTTPSDDDLSLALDGEADAELQARIDASLEALARLEELRAAAAQVAAPVAPLDDDTVDTLITAALDTPVAPPRVAARRRRGATPWLVAASVILLMAVGLSLVWAGRGSEDDQAGASRTASGQQDTSAGDGDAESSFSGTGSSSAEASDPPADAATPGGHGSPTTVVPSSSAELPVLYLGSYDDADELRTATATSFADALKASGTALQYDTTEPADEQTGATTRTEADMPSAKAVDRCAQQLQVTLSMKAGPLQTGYATVDDRSVLVYEFAAASARDGKETTLVAAVGVDACDEVVIFER
ncbi:MAG: hypothetical protein JWO77_3525 [Ilumatobacteraceae bacterium]|nr:hypothetical protein [Ilumatobacteraceae bacterium]